MKHPVKNEQYQKLQSRLTDEFIEWLKSYAERGYDDDDALASFRLAQTAFAQATLEKLGVSYEIEGRK
jgi:flagellum-specific peptidoglycan hydrolase FlgJ